MIHKLARRITEKPRFVLFIAVLLLIPALLGYIGTRTNYDVLSYLPEDVRSVQGEQLPVSSRRNLHGRGRGHAARLYG